MKSITYNSKNGGMTFALTMLAIVALSVTGCTSYNTGIQILPVSNQDVLELNGTDIVEVMRAAGFSDDQIREHGEAVYEGIAKRGAVQVQVDDAVEVVFAARGDTVYVSTRSRGHFYYNVNTGWPMQR